MGKFCQFFSYDLFNEDVGGLKYAASNGSVAAKQWMVRDV